MFERQKPIPTVHPGGYQPYAAHVAQAPGPALAAMLAGRTLHGVNPADITRRAQLASRQRTLLDALLR